MGDSKDQKKADLLRLLPEGPHAKVMADVQSALRADMNIARFRTRLAESEIEEKLIVSSTVFDNVGITLFPKEPLSFNEVEKVGTMDHFFFHHVDCAVEIAPNKAEAGFSKLKEFWAEQGIEREFKEEETASAKAAFAGKAQPLPPISSFPTETVDPEARRLAYEAEREMFEKYAPKYPTSPEATKALAETPLTEETRDARGYLDQPETRVAIDKSPQSPRARTTPRRRNVPE
jgi:hypothetical protein